MRDHPVKNEPRIDRKSQQHQIRECGRDEQLNDHLAMASGHISQDTANRVRSLGPVYSRHHFREILGRRHAARPYEKDRARLFRRQRIFVDGIALARMMCGKTAPATRNQHSTHAVICEHDRGQIFCRQ